MTIGFEKKLPKVKISQGKAKKLQIFSLKIHKVLEFFQIPKTFLNKGTKHKKNYMEGINSTKKNIKVGGSL